MSFVEVFVSRLPKRKILTTQPQWVGGVDQLDFDLELHKEVGPAYLLQLTDNVVNWQNNFVWQGAYDGDYGDVSDSVLKACWRNKHGASFPFFMPTWKNDLILARSISEGATVIKVLSLNQAFLKLYNQVAGRAGRKWYIPEFGDYRLRFSLFGILLIHSDGTEEEIRRFIPIGDPDVDDDELTVPQGKNALVGVSNDIDIKLRLMPGEELPAIATSEVKMISLMYHVRFSGKVQVSYPADYVPRISATMSQVYDEGIFAPDIEASFDIYNPVNPEGTATYRQGRRTAGQPDLTITVSLSSPAPTNGFEVAYTLSGDAVAGTHYNITAGSSPLIFAKGDTLKTITLQTPSNTDWFLERNLIFKLHQPLSTDLVSFKEDSNEFRVYIQADMGPHPPPNVDWTNAASTWNNLGNGGIHSGAVATVTNANLTQENAYVYYEIDDASTAVEGEDYEILLKSGERIINASTGSSNSTLPFTILAGHTPGLTLILNLLYERSTGEDRNEVTFSESFIPEMGGDGPRGDGAVPDPEEIHVNYWPTRDNTGGYSYGPGNALNVGRPWPIEHFLDTEKAHPDNPLRRLGGFSTPPNAITTGYFRNSSVDEFSCDGNVETFPLVPWQRFSLFIEIPSATSLAENGLSRYFRISLRDRGWVGEGGTDISHVVVFDSDSPDGGLITRVDTTQGNWGVLRAFHNAGANAAKDDWATSTVYVTTPDKDIVTHGDSMYICILAHTSGDTDDEPGEGATWQTYWDLLAALHYGVNQVGTPPNDRTQLWVAYNELNSERITGAGHAGPSRSNRLIYMNNYTEASPPEKNPENVHIGVLLYDPVHKFSTSSPLALPIEYWPRPRSRWEPRGNGFLGTLIQHTITM